MIKKSIVIILFIEIILLIIIGADCLIEEKKMEWSFFGCSLFSSIIFSVINQKIQNRRKKNIIIAVTYISCLLLFIFTLFYNFDFTWGIGGTVAGVFIGKKIPLILPKTDS